MPPAVPGVSDDSPLGSNSVPSFVSMIDSVLIEGLPAEVCRFIECQCHAVQHLTDLTVPINGNLSHSPVRQRPASRNNGLRRLVPLPTNPSESAGLCALALPRNLIPVAANQRPGLVAREVSRRCISVIKSGIPYPRTRWWLFAGRPRAHRYVLPVD